MDSPDQGAKGIQLGGIEFSDGKLKFGVPAVGGAYEGTLVDEGASIEGDFSQSGMTLPLKLGRATEDDLPVIERPQEPKPPYPYRVEEVSYENPDEEGIKFAAPVLKDSVAAISVGVVRGESLLDLNYPEDSKADVDMNVVLTGKGLIVEIQGTAEKTPFDTARLMELHKLAEKGIGELREIQKEALAKTSQE